MTAVHNNYARVLNEEIDWAKQNVGEKVLLTFERVPTKENLYQIKKIGTTEGGYVKTIIARTTLGHILIKGKKSNKENGEDNFLVTPVRGAPSNVQIINDCFNEVMQNLGLKPPLDEKKQLPPPNQANLNFDPSAQNIAISAAGSR